MNTKTFLKKTWHLNRITVGKDTEAVSRLILGEFGGKLHQFKSGEDHLTWIIPDEWIVEKAVLSDPKGKVIADFADNPLHLAQYSKSFSGKMSLAELKKHIFTNPEVPDGIPYHYRWQYQFGKKNEWGICLPHNVLKQLKPGKYQIDIKTRFEEGRMFVNEITVPGRKKETVLFAAHTCHPAMVNDGISCIAAMVEVLKYLRRGKTPKYTYKFIFGPEYFTAAAYLSKFGTGNLKYGLYLDMPGNGKPLAFSGSFSGDSYIDQAARIVFAERFGEFQEYDYRTLWGNDELFYDGPGFNISMIALGRELSEKYHTSEDDLKSFNFSELSETVEVMTDLIKLIEQDERLEKKLPGPTYFSRYDKKIFSEIDSGVIQEIEILLAQNLSYLETAYRLQIPFSQVKRVGDILIKNKLVKII